MPETKWTWARLKEHLRKSGFIYVICTIIAVMASDMLFSMTTPRTPENQSVRMYYIVDYVEDYDYFYDLNQQLLETVQAEDESLLEVAHELIVLGDTSEDYTGVYMLMARLAAGNADVFLSNSQGYEYIAANELYVDIYEYLNDGWLKGYKVQPIEYEDEETGEKYVYALVLEGSPQLQKLGIYAQKCYLGISNLSTNPESTMKTVEALLKTIGYKQ